MITVTRHSAATPDAVWSVIANGWTYAAWVVGASRIRAVEGEWPHKGSRVHHSVGAWPILLGDDTEVVDSEPGRLIRMKARTRPAGESLVEITIEPDGSGCRLEMREDASNGALRLIPAPLRQALISPRNTETLMRLALIAEKNTRTEAAES